MRMKKYIVMLLMSLGCILLPVFVDADDFSISVSPEIPTNQKGDSKTSFNIRMKPGETKEYTLHINNKGDKDKKVEVSIVDAGTVSAGVIDKSNSKARMVSGAQHLLTELATLHDKNVTVPAKSVKDVTFTIKAPQEEMPGIILGGIYVLDKNEEEKSKDKGEGMALHNQFGYPTEIMLATSDKQLKAKLDLDTVKADASGGHPSLEIPIQNINPNIIPDLTVKTDIRKKGSSKVLVTDTKTDNKLAPQSIFPHQVKLSEDKIKAGSYTAHIEASSEYGKWEWDRNFEITSKEAKDINERTIQKTIPMWIYVGLIIGLLVLVLIAYLLYRVRKLSKENRS